MLQSSSIQPSTRLGTWYSVPMLTVAQLGKFALDSKISSYPKHVEFTDNRKERIPTIFLSFGNLMSQWVNILNTGYNFSFTYRTWCAALDVVSLNVRRPNVLFRAWNERAWKHHLPRTLSIYQSSGFNISSSPDSPIFWWHKGATGMRYPPRGIRAITSLFI
jgi:hypothetical protein